jgi:serine/threonine protein kinase
MEYVEGRALSTIRDRLAKTNEVLPAALGVHVLVDVLSALHYAHELTDYDGTPLGVVHRDVSPQNVIVTYSGHTKLLDFGVAKASSASVETRVGTLKGKVMYMAPEQAPGDSAVDARTDVFSAGIMLWELLTGHRFWTDRNELHVLASLVRHDPPRRPSTVASVAPELEEVCLRALSPNRTERFDSAYTARLSFSNLPPMNEASSRVVAHAQGIAVGPRDAIDLLRIVRAYVLQDDEDFWTTSVRWATFAISQPRDTSLTLMDGPTAVAILRIGVPYVRREAAISAEIGATRGLLSSSGPTSLVLARGLPAGGVAEGGDAPHPTSRSTPRVVQRRTPRIGTERRPR